MKIFVCIVFFICTIPQSFAQLNLVQFEQIDSLQLRQKRNIIVFIHTDWCKYCQVMLSKTFKNPEVVQLINDKFYFINFNAEEKRNIKFNNASFAFKANGNGSGTHQLAVELGTINKQINFPVLCILNEKNEIIFQYNSFLTAKHLISILKK